MANNPNVNKVVYGNQTVMDITDTTAVEEDVVSGKTFYKASGARSTGSAVIPDISNCYQTTDTAETAIADNDYFPFYDTSATAKRKTLWSNIKAKLKAYFDGIYSTFSGSYNDLKDKPTIPAAQIQSDWNQTTTTAKDFIKNKPTIPAAQIQSDWNQTTTTAKDYIKNKPTIYKKGVYYGTCTGQAPFQTKMVTIADAQGFVLEVGATIYVKFDANNTYTATAEAPVKLNVNRTGAKNVYYGGSSAPTGENTTAFGRTNYINQYTYDGTYWVWQGSSSDDNTTYSAISVGELITGKDTTLRTVRADYLKRSIDSLIDFKTATLAPLDSPAFTGTPTAPTAASGTNTTQIATTAFVKTAIDGHKYPYLLIREGVTASAGSDVRIPASGTDSKIYPSLQEVYIPVAYSDTPIKFSQVKVHSGYLNITMAQAVTNIDMGVMIIT